MIGEWLSERHSDNRLELAKGMPGRLISSISLDIRRHRLAEGSSSAGGQNFLYNSLEHGGHIQSNLSVRSSVSYSAAVTPEINKSMYMQSNKNWCNFKIKLTAPPPHWGRGVATIIRAIRIRGGARVYRARGSKVQFLRPL